MSTMLCWDLHWLVLRKWVPVVIKAKIKVFIIENQRSDNPWKQQPRPICSTRSDHCSAEGWLLQSIAHQLCLRVRPAILDVLI